MLMVAGPHILQIRFSLRFLLRGTLHRFAPGIFEPTHMIATSHFGDLAPDAEFHPITFMVSMKAMASKTSSALSIM